MKIIKSYALIYGVIFKNVKIYTDENLCVFLSSIDSENNLKMSYETNYFLYQTFIRKRGNLLQPAPTLGPRKTCTSNRQSDSHE